MNSCIPQKEVSNEQDAYAAFTDSLARSRSDSLDKDMILSNLYVNEDPCYVERESFLNDEIYENIDEFDHEDLKKFIIEYAQKNKLHYVGILLKHEYIFNL